MTTTIYHSSRRVVKNEDPVKPQNTKWNASNKHTYPSHSLTKFQTQKKMKEPFTTTIELI